MWGRIAIVCSLLLAGCAHVSLPAPIAVDPTQFKGSVAVVLSDRARIEFLDADDPAAGYDLIHRVRTLILAPGGRRASRVVVPIDTWTTLISAQGRSFDAARGDQIATLSSDAIAWRSLGSQWGLLYSESGVASFDVPGAGVGDVVEYEVRTRIGQSFAIAPWVFDRSLPVVESVLEIEVPAGWKIGFSFAARGKTAAITPRIEGDPAGKHRLIFERHDLPPLEPETYGLTRGVRASQVQISVLSAGGAPYLSRWDDLARWYHALTRGFDTLPPDAVRQMDAELDPAVDPEIAIFRWVRDRTRYVAIHEGIGAVRPHPAIDVMQARFGDCKDMATLLVAAYRAHGIDAHPVLISTRDVPPLDPNVPTAAPFNHLIAAIARPGGWHFLDPTSKSHGFSALPWTDQDRDVVVLKGDRAEMARTPLSTPEDNREERTWTVQRSSADALVHLQIQAFGTSADRWRELWRKTADQAALRTELRGLAGGGPAEIRALTVGEERSGEQAELTLRATLRPPGLVERTQRSEVYAIGALFSTLVRVGDEGPRRSPIDLGPPRTIIERVVLPTDGAPLSSPLPLDERARDGVGSYERRSIEEPGRVIVERTLVVSSSRLEPERIGEVAALSDRLAADSRLGLVLTVRGKDGADEKGGPLARKRP